MVHVENLATSLGKIKHQTLYQIDFFCSIYKRQSVQEILLSIVRLWDDDVKIFGSGTKLIVSNKGTSAPTNAEVMKKTHGNHLTYVCLIEKFYPEVIQVTWTEQGNDITNQAVRGEPWKSTKEETYSISSWLTVPVENKHKEYKCEYNHEALNKQQQAHGFTKPSTTQEEECTTHPGNSTDFNRDHLMHRTAHLVYIVLLLKSTMYYFIVLFFIYRMWSLSKHQGKKA